MLSVRLHPFAFPHMVTSGFKNQDGAGQNGFKAAAHKLIDDVTMLVSQNRRMTTF